MAEAIRVENVTKRFGEVVALDRINISFEKGKIYGITGRNGSGKTVLFKTMIGYLKPTGGRVVVWEKEIGKDIDFADNMGIIIENPGFLSRYTGYKNLEYLASIRKLIGREQIRESMERVGLDPDSRKKVGKYSLGMRQRLGIAQAIMENPDILILDEPMNGLDNQGVNDVRDILLGLKKEGKTVILASHNKEDIEVLCDTAYDSVMHIIYNLRSKIEHDRKRPSCILIVRGYGYKLNPAYWDRAQLYTTQGSGALRPAGERPADSG